MTNLKKMGKALLIVLSFVVFNILTDIVIFGTELAPRHFCTALLGGIGGGVAVTFLFNYKRNSGAKFSSDL
ncbi:MAG: hypothetical protein V4619_16645 [Bacteroidota bacterium]